MPEGDTIFRTASRLRQAILGQTIEAVRGRKELNVERLIGCTVDAIEPRGKHLLIRFSGGWNLHSHMGMTGSWHLYRPGEPWWKPEHRAHVVLDTGTWLAICFTPKTLELLSETGLKRHGYLHRLGPDILSDDLDVDDVVHRLLAHADRPLGEAIMDQTIVCGIGNIYKSELLFIERLSPFARVNEFSVAQLRSLIEQARTLMRINLDNAARRTRFRLDGRRFWVYRRSGEKCLVCGTAIAVRRQSDLGRATYFCRRCQSSAPGSSAPAQNTP